MGFAPSSLTNVSAAEDGDDDDDDKDDNNMFCPLLLPDKCVAAAICTKPLRG